MKAVAIPVSTGAVVFNQDGQKFYRLRDADIIFNDGFDWATDQQIADENCSNEHSIQSTATHEIGHLVGLGHSCEEGDACSELPKQRATMFWSAGACAKTRSQIGADDIDGITAIYGPYATFSVHAGLSLGMQIPLPLVSFRSKFDVLSSLRISERLKT